MTTVAIMQPYFMPYLGYYRLLRDADVFVVYDCVQFPRRGWVHRNRLHDAAGSLKWLTLPVQRCPRETAIANLVFDGRAEDWWAVASQRFPTLRTAGAATAIGLAGEIDSSTSVADYLADQIRRLRDHLGLRAEIIRSSALDLPAAIRGEARILEICRRVSADRYVNAPNGRALYDPARFHAAGLELVFLAEWQASFASVLERLATEPSGLLAAELASTA